jgi:benzodiazapine receptor
MTNSSSTTDRLRSILVIAATIGTIAFNWLAAIGRINGITPDAISAKYPTLLTPSRYAFSIWSLIYLGMFAFSIYQALPANSVRFRPIRSLYILSCALNCAWIYFWHSDQIAICFAIIVALWVTLYFITSRLRNADSFSEAWLAKAPFGLYFGWVTAAAFVNLAVLLAYLNVRLEGSTATAFGVVMILIISGIAVWAWVKLNNSFFPLAVAWALTAIAVQQSGHTLIVVACAIGVVACLIASLSFVVSLPSSTTR